MRIDEYLLCYTLPPAQATHNNVSSRKTKEPISFGKPISVGNRNNELYRYAFKLYMTGRSREEVQILTEAYNNQLEAPLDDEEIHTLVNNACKKELDREQFIRKAEAAIEFAEAATAENKADSSTVICLADVEESNPEWLIEGYIPKGEITVLAGDGGVGKTFVWCAIAAAVSSGQRAFVLNNSFVEEAEREPQKVLYFSTEDSNAAVLRPRLRCSGAKLINVSTMDSADENFQKIKLNSAFLENLINRYRPALVIFDPLQSFLPSRTDMAARNQMREAMSKLHAYGKKYGATFLIIMHTNKQQNVWGRTRLADSADIWDISRSVLICGEADSKSHLKYLSQEKSSYGRLSQTVLFRIEDNAAAFAGYTDKRDRDYVRAVNKNDNTAPEREAAMQFILDYLQEHTESTIRDLDAAAAGAFISPHTLRRAKEQLKKDGKIRTIQKGFGKNKEWHISLLHNIDGQMNEEI